ncbi:MAG: hypothetical protein ACJAZO_000741 [Myxococcota bacterium]|jgi:hypothetical protein
MLGTAIDAAAKRAVEARNALAARRTRDMGFTPVRVGDVEGPCAAFDKNVRVQLGKIKDMNKS